MTKSELIEKLSDGHELLNKKEAETVINLIFGGIGDALSQGSRVEIRGFGSFSVREREAREARNPKSGELVKIPSRRTPFLRPVKSYVSGLMTSN